MYQDDHNDYSFQPQPPVIHHTTNPIVEGVVVPGLQAAITGTLTGVAAGAISAWLQLPAWGVAGTATAVASLAAWLSYRGRWAWVLERLLGVDLDRDGFIGKPDPEPEPAHSLRIDLTQIEDGGRTREFIDLPSPEKLPLLASGLLNGRQFSLTTWTGKGQLFSRAEFETLRAELLRRGLAMWNNPDAPAQGITLTGPGRAIFRRLAGLPPTLSDGE